MINKNEREYYPTRDKDNDFSKSVHTWLAQYDEEDDFFYKKASSSLSELTEE